TTSRVQLDRETFSCSICQDLLKDPGTLTCGHSYCMKCIKSHWDKEDEKTVYSCPQCRQTFTARPDLRKNTMLADLVEELKKTGLQPSKKLQENVCSRHDEVMNMFCRTDQQSICYLCPVDEHKGHDTVSAAAERSEKEKDVKLLQQEVEAINGSKRRSDVKQQVRSQQQTEVSRVRELQEKLEQEITELKRRDAEMKKLSHTQDHNQFLHDYPSLSPLSESTHSSSIKIRPLRYFEDVTAAVKSIKSHLKK
uniref:RING-type domain-containing protein n=1 Tax=Labrus bergylta TaxID=56723 RepID=A0A3Q3LTJ1_9LABR